MRRRPAGVPSTTTRRRRPRPRPPSGPPPPTSRTTARSSATARARRAGRPVDRPGSVLDFGRHLGWSIGEIARVDPGYLVWLEGRPEGKPYVDRDRRSPAPDRLPDDAPTRPRPRRQAGGASGADPGRSVSPRGRRARRGARAPAPTRGPDPARDPRPGARRRRGRGLAPRRRRAPAPATSDDDESQVQRLRRDQQLDREDPLDALEDQPRMAGGGRAHRDVILLVRARRDRIDRRGMGEHLVLAGEGRGRVLVDHHPRVDARTGRQEGRQPAVEPRIDEQRRPALADRAQLGERELGEVERERDRLAVEVAAADDPAAAGRERVDRRHAAAGEDERVVGRGVELDVQHATEVVEGVLDGPVDLRHAAQRVRVLDLVDRVVMAALELAVAQQVAELRRRPRPGPGADGRAGRPRRRPRPSRAGPRRSSRPRPTRSARAGRRRRAGAPRWRPSAACR